MIYCECGSDALYSATIRGFRLFTCKHCQLKFIHPRHLESEIYDAAYFSGATHGFGFTNYEEDKQASKSYLEFLLKKIQNSTAERLQTLLDIGAANGYFVELATFNGYVAKGIEVSQSAVLWANNLGRNVSCSSIEDFVTDEKFDVITLLDVLEHLESPKIAIQKISSMLNNAGLLVINVPDQSSLFARICGLKWHAYLPPEHWFYFGKKSLSHLLINSNYEIMDIGNLAKSFKVEYILCTIKNSPQFPLLLRKISESLIKVLPKFIMRTKVKIPIYDNLYAVARKKL